MSTKINLSKNLRHYRKESGLSQKKLAKKAGLVFTVITKIEQGIATQTSIQTIVRLADALSISVDDLIGRKRQR